MVPRRDLHVVADAWRRVAPAREARHQPGDADEGALALLHDLGRLVAVDVSPADLPGAFDKLLAVSAARDFDARAAVLVGFVEQGGAAAAGELRSRVAEDPQGELARTAQEAGRIAADAAAPVVRRVGAVNLLALTCDPQGEVVLLSLVAPEQPVALSIAAVRALVRPGGGTTAASNLLERNRWSRYSPALRSTVLTLLSGRPEFAPAMVDALESGAVPAATLSEPQRGVAPQGRGSRCPRTGDEAAGGRCVRGSPARVRGRQGLR